MVVNEELISFETAIIAKLKGFDLEVTYGSYQDGLTFHRDYIPHNYNVRGLISKPTQSLLQKWLREKHNIYIAVDYDSSKDGIGFTYFSNWQHMGKPDGGYDEFTNCKTYEEALEYGLLEGLKLIK